MVERRPDKTEVHGPIPCPPTQCSKQPFQNGHLSSFGKVYVEDPFFAVWIY